MPRYLSFEDHEEIKKLRDRGWKMKDLATRFGISEASVSNIVRGITLPRKPPKPKKEESKREEEYVDFSRLPKSVLFQHVKECNFIG